ncbi:NERD domain-containing protein [Cellulomonas septica]|uniref:NERD domain-containing protein n=2 Tax=Cellulomonas septica TaxID=285080 RepID=A0ABX1K372_9CELL|nr:nuclease-related domain-containing protein [Cellulomonas septica]NKY41024.1 NERD domain-containing protein [Cellulomonas septica]
MRLRYAGDCRLCATRLDAGVVAVYERSTKTVRCLACRWEAVDDSPSVDATSAAAALVPTEVTSAADALVPGEVTREVVASRAADAIPEVVETGQAGASAAREYERRAAKREQRVRAAHPRLGGLILALSDDPQSTRAWSSGAVGERVVANSLDAWANERVRVLHDRRIPRTRANIDHIAVAPTGVYVIDAKRYKGRPDLRVQGGILRPRTATLTVGGRDCTKLLTGVQKQVELVRGALEAVRPDVRVRGQLCFVDADWPLFGGAFSLDDVDVLWPKKLAQLLNRDGPLTDEQIDHVHRSLAAAFPVA